MKAFSKKKSSKVTLKTHQIRNKAAISDSSGKSAGVGSYKKGKE